MTGLSPRKTLLIVDDEPDLIDAIQDDLNSLELTILRAAEVPMLLSSIQYATELGMQLRTLDQELEELLKKNKVPTEESERYRKSAKALILMKKQRKVFFQD